jgi:hypothetical protein
VSAIELDLGAWTELKPGGGWPARNMTELGALGPASRTIRSSEVLVDIWIWMGWTA